VAEMTNQVKTRPAKQSDVNFIVFLGNKTPELWLDDEIKFAFSRKYLEKWLRRRNNHGFIFELEEPIGFALVSAHDGAAEILSFALRKEYQGQGIGRQLFQDLIKRFEADGNLTQYLYTGVNNKKAQNLYESFGFKKGRKLFFMHRGWGK
jgi:ribosomal protein S18 acetylase RimI-like enzyme